MEYTRSAALVIKDNKILLMHRKKHNKEYYAIPGGHIDKGETIEQTAMRELKEETTLDIELGELFYTSKDNLSTCAYFKVKSFKGTPKLSGEEKERNNKNNWYQLEWIEIDELKNIRLYPREIHKIIEELKTKTN